jgi:hypothetical protein
MKRTLWFIQDTNRYNTFTRLRGCSLVPIQSGKTNGALQDSSKYLSLTLKVPVKPSMKWHFISITSTVSDNIYNKRFWEELIAYFPWYDTGHTENDASNNSSIVACVLITEVTFLPSRCLAPIGGFLPSRCLATIRGIQRQRHTHTDSNVIS